MTDCPNGAVRDLLPDLLHQRLAGAERAMVEAHVAACDDCRGELALLTGLRGAMRRAPAVDVGAIVSALPAHREAPARRAWGGWRAAAAIAAITIGGASAVVATRDDGPAALPAVAAGTGAAAGIAPVEGLPAPLQVAAGSAAPATRASGVASTRELPLEEGLADLSDSDLSALLDEIESLDALPAVEVETTPLVPAAIAGGAS